MIEFTGFIADAAAAVAKVLVADYPYLLTGVLLAVVLKVYVNMERLKGYISGRAGASVVSSVAFGALTPLCACGTMAVVLPMFLAMLPWGAIMAFLTSSALMCPSTFIFYSGAIGLDFALAVLFASLFIGLGTGAIVTILERRTGFFNGALKSFGEKSGCGCSAIGAPTIQRNKILRVLKLKEFVKEFNRIGIRFVLPYFCLFAFLAFLVDRFIPAAWITGIFGAGHFYSVPLAAIVGLPMYVGSAGALPIIQTLLKGGASHGSLLAFLVTGPGTSVAVISGLSVILRGRVVALYILFILLGGIISGYAYDLLILLR